MIWGSKIFSSLRQNSEASHISRGECHLERKTKWTQMNVYMGILTDVYKALVGIFRITDIKKPDLVLKSIDSHQSLLTVLSTYVSIRIFLSNHKFNLTEIYACKYLLWYFEKETILIQFLPRNVYVIKYYFIYLLLTSWIKMC